MPKCSLNCNRGCGHDHSSKAPQSPSIVDIEVVRKLLSQAVVNMCKRVVAAAKGEISREELVDKDLTLTEWLGDTFCGRNKHFESGPEDWNPEGLSVFIKQTIPQIAEVPFEEDLSSDDVVFKACAIFVGEAYKAVEETLKSGIELNSSKDFPPSVEAFIEAWTMLFVGAPEGFAE